MADQRVKDAFNTWRNELRFEPKSSFDYFEAAYNMRDKEQAGAVELIEARIKELDVYNRSETWTDSFIRRGKIDELTTLLAQLTK